VPDPDDPHCPQAFRSLVQELVPSGYDSYDREGPHPPLRRRLLGFVADLCRWENSNNQRLLDIARRLIREANGGAPPKVLDPFAGEGSIPLEALRLGCEAHASELNPVAVLILKCTVEYPQKYGQPDSRPVPDYIHEMDRWEAEASGRHRLMEGDGSWVSAYRRNPLAAEVRYWGQRVFLNISERLAPYYPRGPTGQSPAAYLWARTVKCPNPTCRAEMPLIKQLSLGKDSRRSVVLEPVRSREDGAIQFRLVPLTGKQDGDNGGTSEGGNARCLRCGQIADVAYVRNEGLAGRLGQLMLAGVSGTGKRDREYWIPTDADKATFERASGQLRRVEQLVGDWDIDPIPQEPLPPVGTLGFRVNLYGLDRWDKLFNERQLLGLVVVGHAIREARQEMAEHGMDEDLLQACVTELAIIHSKGSASLNTLVRWRPDHERPEPNVGAQHDLRMVWDYAEMPVPEIWAAALDNAVTVIESLSPAGSPARAFQADATHLQLDELEPC
jgi:adenine-specific DNA methylase